ncbi:hypothetical protein E6O75_ATG03813 [Venturia nashicola]|uniref:Uncharacterized protein n=1 Tax=Venturia nashicola TaxID=86259 RepID=A0A4Z1PPV2_9PEZI|nr:hypothetical protein E6O75_ATG03813 [Venturia nashicola]
MGVHLKKKFVELQLEGVHFAEDLCTRLQASVIFRITMSASIGSVEKGLAAAQGQHVSEAGRNGFEVGRNDFDAGRNDFDAGVVEKASIPGSMICGVEPTVHCFR